MRRWLALLLPLLLAASLPALGQGFGVRELAVFNPLPIPYSGLVAVDLAFLDGEAYNGTIRVVDASGGVVPIQLVNCTFYPSGFYRSCRLLLPAKVPPYNASRYLVTYASAPLKVNVSAAGNLSVKLANLTLVAFNATGSYVVNATNALLVRGPGYTAVFSNTTLLHLSFDDVGPGNMVFSDWPLAGFVVLRNGTIAASAYDLTSCKVALLLNGTLLAQVEQTCAGKGFALRQVFTFSGLEPVVRVDARLEARGEGQLFYPFLRLPLAVFAQALVNGSLYDLARDRSFVPAPKWFAARGGRGWLVVAVNYTSPRPAALLDELRLSLWRLYVNETNPLRKYAYERLLRLHANFSNLILARDRAAAGRVNLTSLAREAAALAGRAPTELGVLLLNYTSLLERPEAYRLLLIPREGTFNAAYQLSGAPRSAAATVVLAACSENPADAVRAKLLQSSVGVAVFYAPLAARLDAPARATVDDYVTVSAEISAVTSLRNVSVKLVYPKAAFRLVEGREAVNYTALEGRRRIEWVLRAIYEGEWSLSLNVSSSGGALVVERAINVTLPPVVPRVVVPRIFNVTVSCVDLRGRPLASYLVNLYDNATRALVASGFTNASGLVRFANVTAGAYQLEVTDGLYSTRTLLLVYANRNVTVTVGLASLRVRVELADGLPLPQAAVYVRDENGSLACAGFTDSGGALLCEGLPRGNYTVSVRWREAIAASSRVALVNDTEVVLRGAVRRVTVFAALGGRPAAGATVNVYSAAGALVDTSRTDENGIAVLYLLPGPYRFAVTKGQYSASATADVRAVQYVRVELQLAPTLWVLIAVTAVLWAVIAYAWHRRTSYIYKERERYRRLLQRLEEMYSRGEVEERFYLKLKQEYESKLNELSRGEAL
ncbi:MAG: carboxypeptidase-like regulatory domain-containing protein [Thermofilum sp.]|jgi:hypothetical protein|nr:carboxypeptidase-like regulatory domain-containing protein [Thermofilum sp.]